MLVFYKCVFTSSLKGKDLAYHHVLCAEGQKEQFELARVANKRFVTHNTVYASSLHKKEGKINQASGSVAKLNPSARTFARVNVPLAVCTRNVHEKGQQ